MKQYFVAAKANWIKILLIIWMAWASFALVNIQADLNSLSGEVSDVGRRTDTHSRELEEIKESVDEVKGDVSYLRLRSR